MALERLHHITAISGDAPRNVDFCARRIMARQYLHSVYIANPRSGTAGRS